MNIVRVPSLWRPNDAVDQGRERVGCPYFAFSAVMTLVMYHIAHCRNSIMNNLYIGVIWRSEAHSHPRHVHRELLPTHRFRLLPRYSF